VELDEEHTKVDAIEANDFLSLALAADVLGLTVDSYAF